MNSPSRTTQFPLGPAIEFLRCLWQVNHSLERRSNRMGKDLGLTAQQRLTLRCIGRFPGITAGQLANVLHIDAGTLSTSLRRLERRELIERRRDPTDARRVTLGLTRLGRQFDAPREGTVEAAADGLLSEIPPEALKTTAEVLARFSELLDTLPTQ